MLHNRVTQLHHPVPDEDDELDDSQPEPDADKMMIYRTVMKKEQLEVKQSHKSVAIIDVSAEYRIETFRDKLKDNNILAVFVPAGCTGDLM